MSETQRFISTSFWDDEWIQTLDPSEKLLYMYLMTNPLTNIAGVYKITVRRICFDTGFNSDTIGHIFTKFEQAGKAHRLGEYVSLTSWPKHQKWEKSEKIKAGIDSCLSKLDAQTLILLSKTGYKYDLKPFFDTLLIPYQYPSSYSEFEFDSEVDSNSRKSDCSDKPEKQIPEQAVKLANLLYSLHKEKDEGYKVSEANINKWAEDIDKINRLDNRSWDDIEKVLRWCKADSFWYSNIMSGSKFREKYPMLLARITQRCNPVSKDNNWHLTQSQKDYIL
jgi:hypothetical protein